jgi:hypothetical protein
MHTVSNTLAQKVFPPCRMNFRKIARLRAAEGLPKRKRGAQPRNRNRLIHGRYSRVFVTRRAEANTILRQTRHLIAMLNLETKWRRFQSSGVDSTCHLPLVGRSEGASLPGGGLPKRTNFLKARLLRAGPTRSLARATSPQGGGDSWRTIFSKTLRFAGSTVVAQGTA